MSAETLGREKATDDGESIDEKRARFEQFSFRVPTDSDGEPAGYVNVANHSYGDEQAGEHCYTVEVRDGEAVGCSCPHATYRDAHCKHQIVCEQVEAVMIAASESGR